MKKIITSCLFTMLALWVCALSVSAQEPKSLEEMYGAGEEYYAMQEQMDRILEGEQNAEDTQRRRRTVVLVLSIAVALVPLGYLGRKIVREKSWKDNPGGTARALAIGLAGGAVLFALNYGIFLLRDRFGQGFNIAFAYLLVLAMIVGIISLLKRKG